MRVLQCRGGFSRLRTGALLFLVDVHATKVGIRPRQIFTTAVLERSSKHALPAKFAPPPLQVARPVVNNLGSLTAVALPTQRLNVPNVMFAAFGQRHDMIMADFSLLEAAQTTPI